MNNSFGRGQPTRAATCFRQPLVAHMGESAILFQPLRLVRGTRSWGLGADKPLVTAFAYGNVSWGKGNAYNKIHMATDRVFGLNLSEKKCSEVYFQEQCGPDVRAAKEVQLKVAV
jgi:hypothetical protein